MTTSKFSKNKGFTLVETLVAIAILLVAVVGPISLIGDALHKLYYAKDEMIAINIAQEGIETVRWKRDSNMLSAVAWDTGITAGYYIIDPGALGAPVVATTCIGACLVDLKPIYFDATSGLYRQNVVTQPTQFSRIVNIRSVNANEIKVSSTVKWRTGGQVGTITVSENLFKWALP